MKCLSEASGDFTVFITGLELQALVSLGEIPSPLDNKKQKNLDQAKYMIDTLGMIKEKTKGNLTSDEEKILDSILYELRMKYLQLTEKKKT